MKRNRLHPYLGQFKLKTEPAVTSPSFFSQSGDDRGALSLHPLGVFSLNSEVATRSSLCSIIGTGSGVCSAFDATASIAIAYQTGQGDGSLFGIHLPLHHQRCSVSVNLPITPSLINHLYYLLTSLICFLKLKKYVNFTDCTSDF